MPQSYFRVLWRFGDKVSIDKLKRDLTSKCGEERRKLMH